jgi:hypothetical protein
LTVRRRRPSQVPKAVMAATYAASTRTAESGSFVSPAYFLADTGVPS